MDWTAYRLRRPLVRERNGDEEAAVGDRRSAAPSEDARGRGRFAGPGRAVDSEVSFALRHCSSSARPSHPSLPAPRRLPPPGPSPACTSTSPSAGGRRGGLSWSSAPTSCPGPPRTSARCAPVSVAYLAGRPGRRPTRDLTPRVPPSPRREGLRLRRVVLPPRHPRLHVPGGRLYQPQR